METVNNLDTIQDLMKVTGGSNMPRYYNDEPEMRRGRSRTRNRMTRYNTRNMYYGDEYEYEPIYRDEYRDDYRNEYRNNYRNEYRDMDDYDYPRSHKGRSGNTQYKMGFGRSQNYEQEELSTKELKEWIEEMQTMDNQGNVVKYGEKFTKQQAQEVAKRLNIKFDKFSEVAFWAAVNLMYNEYFSVLGDNPDIYARLAKAWLCNKDAELQGDEKLHAYYCYIVMGEE